MFVNKLFSRVCPMAEAQSKMPSKVTTTLFSSFIQKSPNSHFPHWEGREENKIFSDITTHFFRISQVSIIRGKLNAQV